MKRADDAWTAFRNVFEKLTSEERAAFVLRQMFAADYDELARILGKSEAECRRLVRSASKRLRDGRPR
ncbi:MAG TPA: sigma factor-like helix-turn-helix DNA-binding protein [Myxococcota bacterium]|nr:sigma factor-like helix-turn-helix DNA-binding protein [Myxococcota bacterium]